MDPTEMNSYWEEFDGAHVVWDHLQARGMVTVHRWGEKGLPANLFGRETRLLCYDGNKYVGILQKAYEDNPDWVALKMKRFDPDPMRFYKKAVTEIQQKK